MKAVPGWDRLFYPATVPTGSLPGQDPEWPSSPENGRNPAVAQHERVASRHPTAGGQNSD
jgi:hypothetical protein